MMKRFSKIMLAAFAGIALLASTVVFGQGWGGNANRGPRFAQQQGFPGPGYVLRTEMYNARIEVLAQLSGLSQDEIKAKLEYKPLWAVLDETKVDFPTYQSKMHDKVTAVVKQAVADGKLTKDQGDFMLERMEDGPAQGTGPRGYGMGYGHGPGFGRGPGFGGGPCGNGNWN